MKVLMTAEAVSGVWGYCLELTRALEPFGVEVVLAAMGPAPSSSQRRAAEALPNLSLVHASYALEWMGDPREDLEAAGRWLLELEQRNAPDVVHINGYAHAALPFSAPVLVAAHSCMLSWWQAVHGNPPPAQFEPYEQRVRAGLAAAELVVAPTAAMLEAVKTHYGDIPNARVIPNARSAERYRPSTKEPFILTAGRLWDEAKNIAALDRVAPRLRWPVCIAGPLQQPGSRRPMPMHLMRLGALSEDDLARCMGRASVYALPARYEPFGLAALEAGLSGCALVLGDIPSLREVWGDAARFVSPDDTSALLAALQELINDRQARAQAAQLASERAQELHPERTASAYLAAYRELTTNKRRRRRCAS